LPNRRSAATNSSPPLPINFQIQVLPSDIYARSIFYNEPLMAKLSKMEEDGSLESFLRQIDELKQKEPHEIELCINSVIGTISLEVYFNHSAPHADRIQALSRIKQLEKIFCSPVPVGVMFTDTKLARLVWASHDLIKQASCVFSCVVGPKLTQIKMQLNAANHALVAHVCPTFGMIVQQAIDATVPPLALEAPVPPPAPPAPHIQALPPAEPEQGRVVHVGTSAARSSANEEGRLVIAVPRSAQSPASAAAMIHPEEGRLVAVPRSTPANAAALTMTVSRPPQPRRPKRLDLYPLKGDEYEAALLTLSPRTREKVRSDVVAANALAGNAGSNARRALKIML
jgi:hypothetical protein